MCRDLAEMCGKTNTNISSVTVSFVVDVELFCPTVKCNDWIQAKAPGKNASLDNSVA
jgi:hypothetical protein